MYPQAMFWSKNKKNEPQFYYINVEFNGVYMSRTRFPDVYRLSGNESTQNLRPVSRSQVHCHGQSVCVFITQEYL